MTSLSHCLSYFCFSVYSPFSFSFSSSLTLCWHPIISPWADGVAWEWMGRLGDWDRERGSKRSRVSQNRVTETKDRKKQSISWNMAYVMPTVHNTQVKSFSATCSLLYYLSSNPIPLSIKRGLKKLLVSVQQIVSASSCSIVYSVMRVGNFDLQSKSAKNVCLSSWQT